MARKRPKKKPGKSTKRPKTAMRARKRSSKRPARKAAKSPGKQAKSTPKARAKAPIATLRTPPSSLDMQRQASSARSGRRLLNENQRLHNKMSAVTAGDPDADAESAYFTGDETPGGDNQTPDQNEVDEIGRAVGIEYNDNEELKGSDKVAERDKHRWENE